MSEVIKGLGTLVCWGCHREVSGVPGRMEENEPSRWEEGTLFFADEMFKCPFCETEDDYAWSDFEECPGEAS